MNTPRLKNLIDEMGMSDLPEKEKMDLMINLADAFRNKLAAKVLNMLTREEQEELDSIIEQKTDQAVAEYMRAHIPGFDSIFLQAYQELRVEMLDAKDNIDQNMFKMRAKKVDKK